MQTTVLDHPLAAAAIGRLRDMRTDTVGFRAAVDALTVQLGIVATADLRLGRVTVPAFTGQLDVPVVVGPDPVVVPILRAGVGMVAPILRLLPAAEVGFVGAARDESSAIASVYVERLPEDLTDRRVFVLDPMLATGGTFAEVLRLLAGRGATAATLLCLICAPDGLARAEAAENENGIAVRVVTAVVDDRLDDRKFIVPGLGDAGDRLFGVAG